MKKALKWLLIAPIVLPFALTSLLIERVGRLMIKLGSFMDDNSEVLVPKFCEKLANWYNND